MEQQQFPPKLTETHKTKCRVTKVINKTPKIISKKLNVIHLKINLLIPFKLLTFGMCLFGACLSCSLFNVIHFNEDVSSALLIEQCNIGQW